MQDISVHYYVDVSRDMERISLASSFSRLNGEIGTCDFLIGFTILQILARDAVVIRIYQLIVKKKRGKEKNSQHKSFYF